MTKRKLFGTDGIRGKAGAFPLDDRTAWLIGRVLAQNLSSSALEPSIVIGRDTRQSGSQIERALANGARAAGARVESAGVITTPGIAYITRSAPFDAGVVISASHNPYQDNGIKIFEPSGQKLPDHVEVRIEAELCQALERDTGRDHVETDGKEPEIQPGKELEYRRKYLDYLQYQVAAGLKLENMKMAIDCANGAASAIAPALFTRLGAEPVVVAASPDGRNINDGCGSLHPDKLGDIVRERQLDLGVAFDGDADRAIFVDSSGAIVDGDHVMLLLASFMKERSALTGNLVVATVMSNMGLEVALRNQGIEMVRAQVGDRFVLEELLARGASLGGEQSGHIIFPDISLAGDGMITAIEVLRAVTESGRPLQEMAGELKRFPQVLVNVGVRHKPPIETLPEVVAEILRIEAEMDGRGRLLVRYSGTENIARVMIEGENREGIVRDADRLAESLRRAIG